LALRFAGGSCRATAIERDAAALLAEYASAHGLTIEPPIPIEDIVDARVLGTDMVHTCRRLPHVLVGNVEPEPAIEGDGCFGIAAYNVQLVQGRPYPVHGLTPKMKAENV